MDCGRPRGDRYPHRSDSTVVEFALRASERSAALRFETVATVSKSDQPLLDLLRSFLARLVRRVSTVSLSLLEKGRER